MDCLTGSCLIFGLITLVIGIALGVMIMCAFNLSKRADGG